MVPADVAAWGSRGGRFGEVLALSTGAAARVEQSSPGPAHGVSWGSWVRRAFVRLPASHIAQRLSLR